MADWLFKEEPTHYSYADLEKDGGATWDGVSNALARKHLRQVKKGDRIWFYHTGKEKAIVGQMVAATDAAPDPADPKGVAVKVKAVRRLTLPVTLETIKADPAFADWELVRISRLSVMPVTRLQWERVEALGRKQV